MILIINRKLPNSETVVHKVVKSSKDPDVDDQEHYLHSTADESIESFKNNFPEFKAAVFTKQIMMDVDII